jgi:heat-inducible transcriptional repressor
VNSSGTVSQRNIDLGDLDDHTIATLRDRFNESITGLNCHKAAQTLADFPATVDPVLRPVATTIVASILDIITLNQPTKIVIAGINNLAQFSDEFETSIRPVLDTLEEQMVLLKLLGEASGEVMVRIGQENQHANLSTASVVASGYEMDDNWAGLGIVGPTRMDYPSTMASVRAVAKYVSRILAEG